MAITNKTNVENYLLTTIDASFDTQIAQWIAAVEKHINKKTDRQIIAEDSNSVNYYDGTGRKDMMIPDFYSITTVGVKSDKDDIAPEDFTSDVYMYPSGRKPIYQLQMDNNYFPKGRQNIVVTGRKGYFASDDVDEDIVFAATVLVAGIVNASNVSQGEIKSESIGRYTVTYSTDQQKIDFKSAIDIIESYRRIR